MKDDFTITTPRWSDIKQSIFHFTSPIPCEENWYGDIPYLLSFGEYTYENTLGDYVTLLDTIRFELEAYVFKGETDIHLYEEIDEYLSISLKDFRCLSENLNNSATYPYEICTKVSLCPHTDKPRPSFVGYAKGIDVIRAIYMGLLNIARHNYTFDEIHRYKNDWDYPPIIFYNKLKSIIIEDFLIHKSPHDDNVQVRQVIVKDFFTINFHTLQTIYLPNDNGYITFYDKAHQIISQIHIPEAKALIDELKTANESIKDTTLLQQWNKKGLQIAQKIRQQLPQTYDVWFQFSSATDDTYYQPILIIKGDEEYLNHFILHTTRF